MNMMLSVYGRHVVRVVLGYTLLVLGVLTILSGLYLFISEQDDIGVGNYEVADAFFYAMLNLPQYVFDLLPMAALIGALLGLGNLARASEIVAIRAAGVSVARLAAWCGIAGLILVGCTWVLGEYIAPPLEQYARQQKTYARFADVSPTGTSSVWAKDGETFIAVQPQSAQNQFAAVQVFRFDEQHRLTTMAQASTAYVGAGNQWILENYAESQFRDGRVSTDRQPVHTLATGLAPELLGLATVNPNSLSTREMRAYIGHLQANDLDAASLETAYAARLARTAVLFVIVMLAVPFALGPPRSSGAGARMMIGILVGAAFFLLARTLERGGAVFGLDPVVIGWAPTVLLALTTVVAIARTR